MPISIENYRGISNTAGRMMTAGNTVHLSKSGDALVLRGSGFLGKIVSWFQGFRSEQHEAVRQHFIVALTSQYGQDVAGMVAAQTRLNHAQNMKKALTSRDIFVAFKLAGEHEDQIKEHNDELASRYGDTSTNEPDSVLSKISQLLSETTSDDGEDVVLDTQKLRQHVDIDAIGNEIRQCIQERGRNGQCRVSNTEAKSIADSIIRNTMVEKYKKVMMDTYLIPMDGTKEDNESVQLLSEMYSQHDLVMDAAQLGKDTVSYLNGQIENAITDAMYSGRTTGLVLLNQDQVIQIVEHILEDFVQQRSQAIQAVKTLDIPDQTLKKEVVSFVTYAHISPSHIKNVWDAGVQMRPHLKVIADADRVSEKELKDAVNGYIDTIPLLGGAASEDDVSVESRKARSFLMMLAQGDDRHSITQELHRQITEAGPFRDYRRAMNYYRTSFPTSNEYAKQEDLYRPGLQRAQEFAAWAEGLGLVLAERLDTPGGEEEIIAADEFPESPDISDHTLTLMRDTDVKIPTPERMNCKGEGPFCDPALAYIEQKLAGSNIGSVKDDICHQFLLDGERSDMYFNGKKASRKGVADSLKEFCRDEKGELDRNMMFGVSQIHQGVFGPPLRACWDEQLGPIPGLCTGRDDCVYRFDKNNDGSISVQAISKKHDTLVMSSLRHGDVFLDSSKSEFEVALNLRLDTAQFTAERDRYFPPEVINATYRYSLYTQDE